jgi:hypothetical protein
MKPAKIVQEVILINARHANHLSTLNPIDAFYVVFIVQIVMERLIIIVNVYFVIKVAKLVVELSQMNV